eukprot:CAMPEP_0206252094 /NCGR_PEP_ID=MMETSP0047_2-20121206/22385_1 /ASSEMBLY_ACC=CAM_ASM_000192 /TAXON_ID=195065 /ORGANISM="Chroomonas mesostigmatica_cf, Strain CCMP1168" /LENGTH=33 /DNA_ID= /DNA_START= /DNA_END= /DNA_ORIENTATION=
MQIQDSLRPDFEAQLEDCGGGTVAHSTPACCRS